MIVAVSERSFFSIVGLVSIQVLNESRTRTGTRTKADALFFRLILVLSWVTAKLQEFFAHCEAGDTEPAGSFGLVSLGQFYGAGEECSFGSLQQARVSVIKFTALSGGKQVVDVF